MAEEFQVGGGNWWESSRLNQRFESRGGSSVHHNDVSMTTDWASKSSLDSVSSISDHGAILSDHAFHMMGLGLSPHPTPWNNNPSLFGSNANFQQDSSYDYDKQMNRLSLDQAPPQSLGGGGAASSTTSSDLDRSASTTVLQTESSSPPMSFTYDISQNYVMKPGGDVTSPTWSKFPQFLRPKQQQPPLQFSNNTTFWNATDDAQFSLFPIHEKQKNISGARDSSTAAKKTAGSTETSSKRPRDQNDTPTSMPAFKVRKEKMGDRITALQQLISPFGKTDTASVLSETIEYIKFLHDQVNVLSTPYIKSGASLRHQQNMDKSKNLERASWQDLKSRGLCLVPISSATFPVTPTFGGCFR